MKYVFYVYPGQTSDLSRFEEQLLSDYQKELPRAFTKKASKLCAHNEIDLIIAKPALTEGGLVCRPSFPCSAFLILPLFPYHEELTFDLEEAAVPGNRTPVPLLVVSFAFGNECVPKGVKVVTTTDHHKLFSLERIRRERIEQAAQFVAARTFDSLLTAVPA